MRSIVPGGPRSSLRSTPAPLRDFPLPGSDKPATGTGGGGHETVCRSSSPRRWGDARDGSAIQAWSRHELRALAHRPIGRRHIIEPVASNSARSSDPIVHEPTWRLWHSRSLANRRKKCWVTTLSLVSTRKKLSVCVFPGVVLTLAIALRFNKELIADDLPTLERPTKATSGRRSPG